MSTMRRGRSGGWYETLSEVPDASKDTQVDSSFGGLYLFAKLLYLRKISISLERTEFPFFMLVVYARDSLEYLETSLFLFLALRRGVIRMYIRARDIL